MSTPEELNAYIKAKKSGLGDYPTIAVDEKSSFDSELFGLLLRKARRDAGYSTVEAFINAVSKRAGFTISKDTWYKIESGKSKPTLEHILAVNITLFGRMNAPQFWEMVENASPKWRNRLESEWENIAPGFGTPAFVESDGYWLGTIHTPKANPAQ